MTHPSALLAHNPVPQRSHGATQRAQQAQAARTWNHPGRDHTSAWIRTTTGGPKGVTILFPLQHSNSLARSPPATAASLPADVPNGSARSATCRRRTSLKRASSSAIAGALLPFLKHLCMCKAAPIAARRNICTPPTASHTAEDRHGATSGTHTHTHLLWERGQVGRIGRENTSLLLSWPRTALETLRSAPCGPDNADGSTDPHVELSKAHLANRFADDRMSPRA